MVSYLIARDNFSNRIYFTKYRKYEVRNYIDQNKFALGKFDVIDDMSRKITLYIGNKETTAMSYDRWFYTIDEMTKMKIDIILKEC